MLYIPKIDGYLKILIDEEVNDFVAINVSEYFKSIREEQNLRKVAKFPISFSILNQMLLIIVYISIMLRL